jgi:hypothetical protein
VRVLGTVCHVGCGSTPKSTIVLFMVLGAILVIFGRRFTLWSLRPYFSKQRLAELDQPGQRRLRMFVNFSRGTGVLIGLFFVVTGILSLLK